MEYVVEDGEVHIVDEFTGRKMEGRRWSEGLHQAVEAKEDLKIQDENITVATVTIQNYFRMYEKLAGMTGTALTEANEFHEIYGLEVVPVPTNQPMMPASTRTTRSTRPRKRSSRPRSTTSSSATRPASRCWSAPSRSRSPSTCRGCSSGAASPTRC